MVCFLAATAAQPLRASGPPAPQLTLVWSSPNGYGCQSLDWADVDHDGLSDLAVGNNDTSGHGLQVFRALPSGGFSLAWESGLPENVAEVRFGDYDGDGYKDLLTVSPSGPVQVFHNNHDGTFTLAWTGPTASYVSGDWADIDGDGRLDFVAFSGVSGAAATLYQNMGGGSFTAKTTLYPGGNARTARFGDMNGDGKPGLFLGVDGAPSGFYQNNGAFGFTPTTTTPTGNIEQAAWADLNGDGKLDLAVATNNSQPILYPAQVFQNGGAGIFTSAWGSGEASGYYSWHIDLADYDGDGLPDIALSSGAFPSQLRIYHNDGGMNFSLAGTLPPVQTNAVRWCDFDGDGDQDLALSVGYTYAGDVQVYRNDRIMLTPSSTATLSPTWTDSPTPNPTATATPTPLPTSAVTVCAQWISGTSGAEAVAAGPSGALAYGGATSGGSMLVQQWEPSTWGYVLPKSGNFFGLSYDSAGWLNAVGWWMSGASATMELDRYSPAGALAWSRSWSDPSYTQVYSTKVASGPAGQAFVVGSCNGS
ncbi:MAG TPA: VCBS repeat-containing protein, partial [bacterium]|nr:VCBS repeat-containing protein [bacterium]